MSWFEQVWKLSPLAFTVVGSVGGWFVHDFTDFRNKRIDAAASVVQSVRAANDDVAKLMLHFDKLALDGTPVTLFDRNAMDEAIIRAFNASDRLRHYVPSADKQIESYESSLIRFKDDIAAMQGPLTGRGYVEAASKLSADQMRLEKSLAESQSSYWRALTSDL